MRCLQALAAAQDLAPDTYEVVVAVDGGGGTAPALATLETPYALHVVEQPRKGRAAACNAAIRAAQGEIVLVLDDDMEPAPPSLARHLSHHEGADRLCVLGAVPVVVEPGMPRAARYIAWKFDLHLRNLGTAGHVFALRDFYSGNTSLRRDVLLEVGLYDESFTVYGNEDLELSLRLRAAGVTLLFDPEALARQHYEKPLAQLVRDTREKGATAVLLARAHPAAFGELQLARPRERSRAWRTLRAAVLRAGRRGEVVPRAVLGLARLLERTPLGLRPHFYSLVLDLFYWLGAEHALATARDDGPLADLAADLRRGPLRLLLHG
jgi:glycosyltransferase involved in cell wall biosynthesis